ncbi:hypothetical protein DUNSADRAFT_6112 [Dunaliella salina]|uniref:Glycosyltransferase n=1 Tax=Dunaliella salina TaxID=3046 RepID=A0ABQ7H715_DUNSA|nr:hypothetical protein DUNSADRAFT_6112 [Dunaliella salina]|eukprot:KAF5842642.1 hypothetical protein DUNSADRAFT_6112 [Dunaliella salina]
MHRILFITLEFSAATFSGNGVYAQSQVRSLTQLPETEVLVLSAKPCGHTGSSQAWGAQLLELEVSRWGSLDASAPFDEFASKAGGSTVRQKVAEFDPSVCLFVDWSSLPAWEAVRPSLTRGIPAIYCNYRVFSRTETGEGLELVRRLEAESMEKSAATVVLSASDRDYLLQNVSRCAASDSGKQSPCHVLLCALREELNSLPPPPDLGPLDFIQIQGMKASNGLICQAGSPGMAALEGMAEHELSHSCECPSSGGLTTASSPSPAQLFQTGRPYLTCCVRLAREKEPERFVALVEQLAKDGSLQRHGLTPVLVGATNDSFAQGIKLRLQSAAPRSILIERFMGPQELATEVFSRTRLNVHPCTYDAFGMTIVEAASMGAPSIVHSHPGAVGAADLLQASNHEVVLENLAAEPPTLASRVVALLDDGDKILLVARRAAVRARSWTEARNALELLHIIKQATACSA